jgi:glycosyltransferase involved in cell wall biosynthesis
MDLPRFQHIDLQYEVGLPLWLFRAFDFLVYHVATSLWVCSRGIADRIRDEMLWGSRRVDVVENGAFPLATDAIPAAVLRAPRVFIYAGQLLATRGIADLIDEFSRCKRPDVELRLCGGGGEWITGYTSDPRIKYLGKLDEQECASAVYESDVGVVYQPEGKYYDIVYPTKLALYIAHGKPVLATDNLELRRSVNEKGVGLSVRRDEIAAAIDNMTTESIMPFARKAMEVRCEVFWDAVYDSAYSRLQTSA